MQIPVEIFHVYYFFKISLEIYFFYWKDIAIVIEKNVDKKKIKSV